MDLTGLGGSRPCAMPNEGQKGEKKPDGMARTPCVGPARGAGRPTPA